MRVQGKDLGRAEVFEVVSGRRGPDGVCKDFLAFKDDDPGLKKKNPVRASLITENPTNGADSSEGAIRPSWRRVSKSSGCTLNLIKKTMPTIPPQQTELRSVLESDRNCRCY
ncbi:uncharacterized protein LOC119769313 [Culex quinquefasciatus]|uniref:uncharacterized protein LOC119769313 n=1 Tax=Culex quinquefasciatus TaxID=7176 RepID=UPI0018E2F667|nr:uncharacterized protein LOC119769313 [Culex quinquefasciatus]